jgi:hypothetical protein
VTSAEKSFALDIFPQRLTRPVLLRIWKKEQMPIIASDISCATIA